MIISFDIESTGTNPIKDRIVSLSVIKLDSNLNQIDKKTIVVNPLIFIPEEASKVHGFYDKDVKDKPTFQQYSSSLFKYFNDTEYLAGYNIKKFDIPLLVAEFERCGLIYNPPKILDMYKVAVEKEKRDLSWAYKFYTNKVMENAHDADADNSATVEIMKGQMTVYGLNVEEIADMCKLDTLDFDGKLKEIDGVPCYNFGKCKGIAILKDRGFGDWMLREDFSTNTKNILRSILYPKQ